MDTQQDNEEDPPKDAEYVANYPVQLSFPATVLAAATEENDHDRTQTTRQEAPGAPTKTVKTSNELVQLRLLEAGLLFEVPVSLGETAERLNQFCQDLEKTGCFHNVKVEIGGERERKDLEGNDVRQHPLNVVLEEKDWYRLHLGGGVKAQELLQGAELGESAQQGPLPVTAELEASAGIRNITGCLDQSALSYRLDTKGIASWMLRHERPLYTLLPSPYREMLLLHPTGSRFAWITKASLDTHDFEYTRSYREYQRRLDMQIANQHSLPDGPLATALTPQLYSSLTWSFVLRDIVPRRQVASPWLAAASPSIVSEAGPSTLHTLTALVRTNGAFTQEGEPPLNPTQGWQAYGEGQVALPPGDVSFAKIQSGVACHIPIHPSLAVHWVAQAGWLRSFGSTTTTRQRPPTVSDRFHIGGPLQLPGFLPAGIGPRDTRAVSPTTGDCLTPGGDSTGGDLYYRTAFMASVPAFTSLLPDGRAFAFAAAGTCVQQASLQNHPLVSSLLGSTRASLGVGFATTAVAGSRLEVTYAVPLRYAPVDARRNFQVGIGVSIG